MAGTVELFERLGAFDQVAGPCRAARNPPTSAPTWAGPPVLGRGLGVPTETLHSAQGVWSSPPSGCRRVAPGAVMDVAAGLPRRPPASHRAGGVLRARDAGDPL